MRVLKNKKVLNTWIGPVESESANEFKIEKKGKVGKECCLPKRQLLGRVSKVWKGRQAGWHHMCHTTQHHVMALLPQLCHMALLGIGSRR